MATNTFRPLGAASPVSSQSIGDSTNNFSTLMRNRSYDRMDAGSIAGANPDFDSGAAGRIIGSLTENNRGRSPQISRGYIRRTVLDNGDRTSRYRLYFMYNPDSIQRSYVSYLDQEALDPFNTVFGSNNLVAPPGILDFSFDLLFDRQAENANGTMPRGVLEDFDYFDLVIRGVVPDDQSRTLPDNGIMMINPRNITVVFSPQLSVQGRPDRAHVTYEKFDHRMRPIRARISISMKAVYVGAVRQDFTFAQAKVEGVTQATIPYDETIKYHVVSENLKEAKIPESALSKFSTPGGGGAPGGAATSGTATGNTGKYPITGRYGENRGSHIHGGVDIGCPRGTLALAPVPLTIRHAGGEGSALNMGGFGISVAGETQDGLLLIYGHLMAVSVNVGQSVRVGQILGQTNNTGSSQGDHLHFEIRRGGEGGGTIDPMPYLSSGWQILA